MPWFRFVENPRKLTRVAVAAILVLLLGMGTCWAWTFRWLSTGRERLQNGQITLAQQSLRRFVRWHPKHVEAHYLLALTYGERRDWKSALTELTQVPDDSPQAVSARWREADVLLQLNRAADAERALARALELDRNCLEAIRGLLHLYRWQDRYADAEPLVWQAYELTSLAERPPLLAEWFRFRFAQYPSAENYVKLRDFIANQPEDVETAIALVRWSLRERQLGWARTLLEQVFAKRPDKLDARAGMAECLMELGNGSAVAQLLAEWPSERHEARYWRLCGRWQQEFALDYEAAVTSFELLLAEQPDDWQSRFRLANCLRILDRNEEADRETREAERVRDVTRFEKVRIILDSTLQKLNRPENRFEMGEFYRAVGYTREAKAWYELALALDSQHEPSREAIRAIEAAN